MQFHLVKMFPPFYNKWHSHNQPQIILFVLQYVTEQYVLKSFVFPISLELGYLISTFFIFPYYENIGNWETGCVREGHR
jgi:hypothetical protein